MNELNIVCEHPFCKNTLIKKRKTQKFCSKKCNDSYHNVRLKVLAYNLRENIIKERGGACGHCGFDVCFSALEFHHLDPNTKNFDLSLKNIICKKPSLIKEEADKCALVCSNCHRIIHKQINDRNNTLFSTVYKQSKNQPLV